MEKFARLAATAAIASLILGAFPMARADTAELKILAGGGITGPLNALAPEFEHATGQKVTITYDATPGLIKRSQSEPFDLCVCPREVYADATARVKFAPGPAVDVARVGFGIAVRSGAAKPDISTPDKLKAALLAAKTISFLPASAAGAQVIKVFERLGIADEMKAKTKVQTTPAAIPQAVANGEAELAIFLINVLAAPGVDVVGPLPAEINPELVFAAALAAEPGNAAGAKAFVDHLKSPAGVQAIKAKGMEPAAR